MSAGNRKTLPHAYQQEYSQRPQGVSFRRVRNSDSEFLAQLYASTRATEMALVDWPEVEKQVFLRQQFEAQHQYYLTQFQSADFLIIEQGGKACGRIYLDRRSDEIRLIDIALTETCRNQGIGRRLLEELLDEGKAKKLPIRIHVEQYNPAYRLYQRLGFQVLEDQGVYLFMEWRGF